MKRDLLFLLCLLVMTVDTIAIVAICIYLAMRQVIQ